MAKVASIDASDFVLKTNYNTKITELENKITDTSGLLNKKLIIILKLLNLKIKFLILII